MWWFLSLHLGFRARDESDQDDAASFKVEYDFHSNLFLIRTLCEVVNFLGSTKPFCEFQTQTVVVKIFVKFRYKSFLKSFL